MASYRSEENAGTAQVFPEAIKSPGNSMPSSRLPVLMLLQTTQKDDDAFEYHPDRNQGMKTGAKFKDQEAYEVLTDSQKRAAHTIGMVTAAFERRRHGQRQFWRQRRPAIFFSDVFDDTAADVVVNVRRAVLITL